MTEKQFVEIDDGLDFSIKHIESGETFYDCESVVDILNELAEENKELKEENEYLCEKIKENEWHWNTIDEDRDVWRYKCNQFEKENHKIKSILLKKVDELNDAYNKSAKAGMPTGGIIGELDSFEEICRIMEWIE